MKAYFFLHPGGPPEKAAYQHTLIALAEGFKKMGWEIEGNLDYWQYPTEKGFSFLITQKQFDLAGHYDVVLVSPTLWEYQRLDLLPKALLDPNFKRTYKLVLDDSSDGYHTPGELEEVRHFDLVLKSHFSQRRAYPKNFTPWQFGLTDRLLDAIHSNKVEQSQKKTLSNFRVNHQLRDLAEEKVLPFLYEKFPKDGTTDTFKLEEVDAKDKLFWQQTGRRHYPSYYQRLGNTLLSNAIGGWIEKPIARKKGIVAKFERKLDAWTGIYHYDRVTQFDSWRFWESLLAGCGTLHLDFEKYGIALPVMPVNGTHYFGIDLDQPKRNLPLTQSAEEIAAVGERGRQWALANYAPEAVAKRLAVHLNL